MRQGRIADAANAFGDAVESNEAILKKIESQNGFANLTATEQESQTDPEKAELKRALALSLNGLETLRDIQGKTDEALGNFERSRGLRADLYKSSLDEKKGHSLMRSEARVGNSQAAKELSDKFGGATLPNPEAHLDRACALAQAARSLQGDEKAALVVEALLSLERAVSEGYLDPFRIAKDLDLLPLRNETRYLAILQKLGSANLNATN